jgi:photosystem II stability/assembly factor-like uncharacterized protein
MNSLRSLLVLTICAAPLPSALVAQRARASGPPPAVPAADSLNNLKFRNLGPAVAGGRVTSVAGVPGQPEIYYVGAAAGGVWKTTDGGHSWDAIFADQPTASIGAIALAPSNPNLVWVGTGESNVRNDATNGRGVYFSPDAGKSWQFMGLENAGQISRIVIDPTNPDVVFIAAVGHAWTPNPDRGVFRTADGGKSWQKVLYVNDTTGAADLVMLPGNPRVLFAGMTQLIRYPWQLVSGGPGSGLYRSTDGGLTWERLTEGLPPGPLGRIAVAVSASNPSHVYALVEAKRGLLWDSHDLGDHWSAVSDNHNLSARPFYFNMLHVSPVDDEKVFFSSFQLLESDDGGKTAHQIDRGVHVDHHAFWIDPQNPDRMVQGNDGGAYVTYNGAKTWQWFNNLPIEQFYMVAADNNDPYTLCGGLQDNNGWCGPSSGAGFGGMNGSEWYTVAGGDGEYIVPAPSDSTILYAESQNGSIRRIDKKTGLTSGIRPYVPGVEDMAPADLKYRFNWTTPIEVSRTDPNTVWMGANVVFKTTDGGAHWTAISPDLTRNDKSKQVVSGGPIQYDISGAESYNTILTVNVAPSDSNVLWVGTDDGLVQVTRDGGKTWTNVAGHFPHLAANTEGRVYQIGVSPFDAGTAYLAVDRHEFDDNHPYVYKTTDYGKSWTDISGGLPADASARVVREDPNARGFLVLGTDAALFYSRDAGGSWHALKAGFPTTPVYDLKFIARQHDLVIATHGRGLFVMDDITPLEELTPQVEAQDFHVFTTLPTAIRVLPRRNGIAPGEFTAPNAPSGAVIDYYLKTALDTTRGGGDTTGGPPARGRGGFGGRGRRGGGVIVTVTDAHGDTVSVDSTAPGLHGVNRFVWSMRYEGPTRINFERPTPGEGNPFRRGGGPRVMPGSYTATLTAGDHTDTTTLRVDPDPIVPGDPAAFRAQLQAALELRNQVSALNEMLNRISSLQSQLQNIQQTLRSVGGDEAMGPVQREARSLGRTLKQLKDSLYNSDVQRGGQDDIHYLSRFQDRLQGLSFGLGFAYAQPPSQAVLDEWQELKPRLDAYLAQFNGMLQKDVAQFNQTAQQHQAPTLLGGAPIQIQAVTLP